MTNVVIITYLFPPSGGVGPPRYVAYARYLPRHGCRVSVLTARQPHTPVYDPDLIALVPPETRIHRVFNPDVPYGARDKLWKSIIRGGPSSGHRPNGGGPARLIKHAARHVIQRVCNPDVQRFWAPFVVRAARRIIKGSDIHAVILNTPPFSLWGIVPRLKREFPQVKWITECRDDWVGYFLKDYDTASNDTKYNLAVRLERDGIRASDFVVTTTPSQRDAMRRRYADLPKQKFLSVTNGFDAERYATFRPRRAPSNRMVITYFGTLYASKPYDIGPYFEAIEGLPPHIRDCIETRFIGRIAREAEPAFERRRAIVRRYGFYPLGEALPMLEDSDYMLLVENEPTAISAKLFDYLPTGVPILALTPSNGEVARVIEATRTGATADGRNPAAIRTLLRDAYARWRGEPHRFQEPDLAAIGAYDRATLVGQFACLTGLAS